MGKMVEVIGIKFRPEGKVYNFSPLDIKFSKGDVVIVETAKGIENGTVEVANFETDEETLEVALKPIIRKANQRDLKVIRDNKDLEEKSRSVFVEKAALCELEMKLVDVEYAFDRSKITFYFSAKERLDFRQLVKELAAVYHTRIELRQIGVRDEARILGGLGICGKEFCCAKFPSYSQPVTIKVVKEQGISLNPSKISGACGRLMCCLGYEYDSYQYLNSVMPQPGDKVVIKETKENAYVVDINKLTGRVRVATSENSIPKVYNVKDLKFRKKNFQSDGEKPHQ